MISVEQARASLRMLYERRCAQWALETPEVAADIALHPPNKQAVLDDGAGVTAWANQWKMAERQLARGAEVLWESRQWANADTQRVPVRFRCVAPADLAAFVGNLAHWKAISARAEKLRGVLGGLETSSVSSTTAEEAETALRRRLTRIADLDDADFIRLNDVLDWLILHPDSGLYPQQVPVRGVDTKWISKHSGLVMPLLAAATGRAEHGLQDPPGLMRMRFLDPALAPGGLADVSAPVEQLAALKVNPSVVIVVENLQPLLSLPELPGAIAIHGSGYAVDRIARLPWVGSASLVYWGDLDVDGFRILHRLRQHVEQVRSVLMDRSTLKNHLDLTVPDQAKAARTIPEGLTGLERDGFVALEEFGGVRLEQERVPWETALAGLRRALR